MLPSWHCHTTAIVSLPDRLQQAAPASPSYDYAHKRSQTGRCKRSACAVDCCFRSSQFKLKPAWKPGTRKLTLSFRRRDPPGPRLPDAFVSMHHKCPALSGQQARWCHHAADAVVLDIEEPIAASSYRAGSVCSCSEAGREPSGTGTRWCCLCNSSQRVVACGGARSQKRRGKQPACSTGDIKASASSPWALQRTEAQRVLSSDGFGKLYLQCSMVQAELSWTARNPESPSACRVQNCHQSTQENPWSTPAHS